MHRMHNAPHTAEGPKTTGGTIHWAGRYDTFTNLLGLGVNARNSRMIVEMAGIGPGDRVLDAGCGTGSLTLTAELRAGPGGSVTGLDASPEMIAVARAKAERGGSRVVFDLGLIESMAYPDAAFDVVISRLVIHHLPDDLKRRGFREMLRVLRPGGRVFLADFRPPANPVLAHVTSAMVGSRMMHYDVRIIPQMVEEAGFVDVATGPTRSAFLAFVSGRKPAP